MESSGDGGISSLQFLSGNKNKLMKYCIKRANRWKFANFNFKNILFYLHFKIKTIPLRLGPLVFVFNIIRIIVMLFIENIAS